MREGSEMREAEEMPDRLVRLTASRAWRRYPGDESRVNLALYHAWRHWVRLGRPSDIDSLAMAAYNGVRRAGRQGVVDERPGARWLRHDAMGGRLQRVGLAGLRVGSVRPPDQIASMRELVAKVYVACQSAEERAVVEEILGGASVNAAAGVLGIWQTTARRILLRIGQRISNDQACV